MWPSLVVYVAYKFHVKLKVEHCSAANDVPSAQCNGYIALVVTATAYPAVVDQQGHIILNNKEHCFRETHVTHSLSCAKQIARCVVAMAIMKMTSEARYN